MASRSEDKVSKAGAVNFKTNALRTDLYIIFLVKVDYSFSKV